MEKDFYAEYFDAEDHHWWFVGRRRILLSILDRYLPPAPAGRDRRILDVGCGTGTMLAHLAQYGVTEGVDADSNAVRFCHRRGVSRVSHLTTDELPFAAREFDLVTAFDVLEHVEDDLGMLREIERVLRPGGMLLLSVPAYRFLWGPHDEINHHKRRYVSRHVRERLREAGLAVERVSYFNTLLFPPIAATRILRPDRPRSRELKSDFALGPQRRMNSLLGRLFSTEAAVLPHLDLPFGVSILGLAAKRDREAA